MMKALRLVRKKYDNELFRVLRLSNLTVNRIRIF